jgi:CubicO group peptidase (beta-lactamase class C family)
MKVKQLLKRIGLVLLTFALLYVVYYCWISFPIATGYGAKIMCSSVFISERNERDIRAQELSFSPLDLVSYAINYKDSSVTASMFGLAKRKAVYRKGLGATLVSISEDQLRQQQFRLAIMPLVNRDSTSWPAGDKIADTLPAGINSGKLKQVIADAFVEKDSNHLVRTRAVVVVYDGHLIGEQYAPGFSKDTRLTGWSMTKSITGALTGILVKEGKLNIEKPAPVPEWSEASDPRHGITIKNLLQQSTGLDFLEDYAKSSDATKMLFERADMGAYTAAHRLKVKPGSEFYYSSGNSNILSRILRQTIGERDYHAFPYEQLFYKCGMYSMVMEPDASGTFVGSSYCYGTARDWARFGLLYLQDGIFNQERLLPEGWVKATTTPATSALKGEYGFQFWLNAGEKNNPSNRKYPGLPTDMFYCDGFEGQNVFIIPSHKLVVVRLGLTRNGDYDVEGLLNGIMQSVGN